MLLEVWIVLFIHLAWTTHILLKDWMRMMLWDLLLPTSALFISVFRSTNGVSHLAVWVLPQKLVSTFSLSTSCTHFVRDTHHNSWAIITEDAAGILTYNIVLLVLVWACVADVAVSVLLKTLVFSLIFLLWTTQMLMDLHQLHNRLLKLNVFTTSWEVSCFSWSFTFASILDSKTCAIFSFLKLINIIVVERADISLVHLMLNLIIMMILLLLGAT